MDSGASPGPLGKLSHFSLTTPLTVNQGGVTGTETQKGAAGSPQVQVLPSPTPSSSLFVEKL